MKIQHFFVLLLFIACTSKNDEDGLTKESIVGAWENVSLNVKMNTFQNRDTTSYLRAPEGKWEEVLKIKPIRTVYLENGEYTSTYRDLSNKVVGESKGTWGIRNDSLVLTAEGVEYTYSVIIENGKARFISLQDWDQDGKVDDLYDGWQKKVE
ncbi:MAG: hypothetical protein RIG77_16370 [Cyclobacteriaceae bacterium]